MDVSELYDCSCNRGFIASLFYPICLAQEFRPKLQTDVIEYFTECDQARHEMLKERLAWLDGMKIKYKFSYEAETDFPDINIGKTFILRISFARREEAAAYKLAWS
jgi:hypothetical protein